MQSRPLCPALYAISVRRLRTLPAASFRFHLTMDTLAVRLTLPTTKRVVDFHHQAIAHGGRTTQKQPHPEGRSCFRGTTLLRSVNTASSARSRVRTAFGYFPCGKKSCIILTERSVKRPSPDGCASGLSAGEPPSLSQQNQGTPHHVASIWNCGECRKSGRTG